MTDDIALYANQRAALRNAAGVRLIDFTRTLQPKYRVVYRDIGLGYLALILSCVLTAALPSVGVPWLLAAVIGAGLIGSAIAYLQLFIHEGAHYNLAADRRRSDLVCDLLISWMAGTTVANYRLVHFRHHRELGKPDDSEHTYFFALDPLFILKSLTGWRALEVLLFRRGIAVSPSEGRRPGVSWPVILGAFFHLAVVVLSLAFHQWSLAFGWIGGVVIVFPFLGALRQLLEHRRPDAGAHVDYFREAHGAYSRLFSDGPIDAIVGGAGFNRHLLHHWEPQLSYTNLPELERFLLETPLRDHLVSRRSTYWRTFRSLLTAG
ncbi:MULTISPECIES: fatty acid desaturase [unclassified Beijerinckia]|uniref:fatty acid desaturase family protein n=1 Tax=unclassified Beijerinckia TaxID=2638183 RepID=UPI00089C0391|nr:MULTISPECIES: fatty acid desaturase [unclassified Beijerinckia]MDH7799661.1 fatty acid desaturase [Beijerinckia sp. GAS462]SEB48885.1 Fatty acid desaturase [Beijerinckia sp. 28-YEA-48]